MRVGLVCRWFGGGSRLASEVRESSVVLNHVWAQSGGPVASLRELGAAIYGVIDGGRPQVRLWVGWSGSALVFWCVGEDRLAGGAALQTSDTFITIIVIIIIIIIVTISIIIILHDYQTC